MTRPKIFHVYANFIICLLFRSEFAQFEKIQNENERIFNFYFDQLWLRELPVSIFYKFFFLETKSKDASKERIMGILRNLFK